VRGGRGVIENKHSTDVESTKVVCASVAAFVLKVSHAPSSVECLFSVTLLRGGGGGGSGGGSGGGGDGAGGGSGCRGPGRGFH